MCVWASPAYVSRLAVAAALTLAWPLQAAAAEPEAAAPAVAKDDILVYDPAFFADAGPASALDMIKRLPAFVLEKKGRARGLGAARGNVLIDGLPFTSKAETVDKALDRIPASHVLRIELGRDGAFGSAAREYSSVANVVLAPGVRTYRFAVLEGNVQRSGGGAQLRAEAAVQQGPVTLQGEVQGYGDSARAKGGAFSRVGPGEATHGRLTETSAASGAKLRGSLSFEGDRTRSSLDLTLNQDGGAYGSAVDQSPGALLEALRSKYNRRALEAVGRLSRTYGGSLRLDASILQSVAETKSIDQYGYAPPAFAYRNDYLGRNGETVARIAVTAQRGRTDIEAGGEIAYNWLSARSAYVENGAPVALPAQRSRIAEERGELFIRARTPLGPRLRVDAGVAVEASRIRQPVAPEMVSDFQFVKPELVINYAPASGTQVHLTATRDVSQLNFADFVTSVSAQRQAVIVGNPALEPAREWKAELGFDQAMGEAALSVAIGRAELEQTLDYVAIGTLDAPGNIGGGNRTYVTAALTYPVQSFGLKGATLNLAANALTSSVTDPVTGRERRLSGEAALSGTVSLRKDLTRWPISWTIDAQASSPTRAYRLKEIREYSTRPTAGLEVEYRPTGTLNLSVRVQSSAQTVARRAVYSGSRASGGLAYVEERASSPGGTMYVRLRRKL